MEASSHMHFMSCSTRHVSFELFGFLLLPTQAHRAPGGEENVSDGETGIDRVTELVPVWAGAQRSPGRFSIYASGPVYGLTRSVAVSS